MDEWILSLLYQRTHSAVSRSTSRTPLQFRVLAYGRISSVLYRPMVDSMSALSSASPTVPIDPAIPASASSSVNASAVYCEPASGWINPLAVNSLLARRRVASACPRAPVTRSLVLLDDVFQPRIRREYTSATNDV